MKTAILFAACLIVLTGSILADNNVEVHFNYPQDTIFVGDTNTLEFWIANEDTLHGFSLGFEFSEYQGEFLWDSSYGNYPPLNIEIDIELEPCLFVSSLSGSFFDVNFPDSMLIGAAALPPMCEYVLLGDSIRTCYTMKFFIPEGEPIGEICVDNIFYPPAGEWIFDPGGAGPIIVPDYFGCVNESDANPDCPAICFPVVSGPAASFDFLPQCGYAPLSVQFNDNSQYAETWYWDFDDGDTSTEQNPQHIYTTIGTYYPSLTVTDTLGEDTYTTEEPIIVYDSLDIIVIADPVFGRLPLEVAFQSEFNQEPDSMTWYFGDGDISVNPNPVHEYTDIGIYDVKLVAELCGSKDSVVLEDYISVTDIQADFEADIQCSNNPLTVQFTDLSTGTYPIDSWEWDFGDSATSTDQNPIHTFTGEQAYDITLIVEDIYGTDTLIREGFITTQINLTADFEAFPNTGKSPLVVMFEPIIDGAANIYFWDFGDGDTSDLKNPIHIYETQGKYDVEFTAILQVDGCDLTDTIMKVEYIEVNDLDAEFEGNPVSGVIPHTVQFEDNSSGDPIDWYWEFGDGDISYDQNPMHTYLTEGTYDVFLRVDNGLFIDSLLRSEYIFISSPAADLYNELYTPNPRPGFDMELNCVFTNIGTLEAENCSLHVVLPSEMIFYDVVVGDSNYVPYPDYSITGNEIAISLGNLEPSDWYSGYLGITGNLPPWVPIGDILYCTSNLTTTTYDIDTANNYVEEQFEVVGSIDPNDKLAFPEGEGIEHGILSGQHLIYMIQFENKPIATADAIYVCVVDTLDQKLDWNTLRFGSMSHPDDCDVEFDPYTGVITWFCDSIMLPPNVNPPEGEGYVTFSINPLDTLSIDQIIENEAWIRFDYNEWLHAPEEGDAVFHTIVSPSICGDANDDGTVNVSDAVWIINYVFVGGDPPSPIESGDANCDGTSNVSDAVWIINYVFVGGNVPCDTNGDTVPDC
jgi:PKD repeat protein